METGTLIAFRKKAKTVDVTPHLDAMRQNGVGENDSDRIRIAIMDYTKTHNIQVPV